MTAAFGGRLLFRHIVYGKNYVTFYGSHHRIYTGCYNIHNVMKYTWITCRESHNLWQMPRVFIKCLNKCPKVVGPLYLLSLFNILKNLTLFCPVLWKHKIYCVILLPAVLWDFMRLRSLEGWRWLKLNSLSGLLLPLPLLSPQLGPRRWPVPVESSGLLSQYLSSRK